MKSQNAHHKQDASTLVVTVAVVATILVLLASAVAYTQHVSKMADRTRKIAQAMEVGDGHLEYLFTHWRNISRAPGLRYSMAQPATNFFATTDYPTAAPTPWTAPAPTPNPWPGAPPQIPRPPTTLFPDVPGYTVSQYRIQAVTPMIDLDNATGNSILSTSTFPPAAYGPNTFQYSFFYLASVNVTIPALNGDVTAKVRRIFEKKYDNPWTFAIFYNDDLELQPSDPLIIDGPIHTNNNLYIGTSNLTVQDSAISTRPPSKVSYAGEYLNGFAPNDTSTHSSITKPTFPPKLPPAQDSPYLPFGWNLKMTNADGSVNNDSYHELIEQFNPCGTSETDPLLDVRYYNQAGMKAVLVNTALTANSAAGATVITVANVTGLYEGMVIQIGNTPERRSIAVGGINCTTKQITVGALTNAHTATEPVVAGELTTLTANVAAGVDEVTVASTANFVSGDTIRVGTTNPETKIINSFPGSNRIKFTTNLAGAHVTGERVQAGDITVYNAAGTRVNYASSATNDKNIYNLVTSCVYPRRSLYDYREVGAVRVADVDINKITVACDAGTVTSNGVFYIADTGAVLSSNPTDVVRRGIRLINGYALPLANGNINPAGLTVVSENPVYIKGNYNTGATSANPPSNTDPATSSVVSPYVRRPSAIIADAVTVLSGAWSDSYTSSTGRPARAATSTTINSAIVSGTVPSGGGNYSGGAENFIRLLEDWNADDRVFCYWGSMVQLYQSKQAIGTLSGVGNLFKSPKISRYYWDSGFGKTATTAAPYLGSPPGNLIIAAYLQQQRWYQVY